MLRYIIIFVSLTLASCSTTKESVAPVAKNVADMTNMEKADYFAHKYLITDGHVDLPYRLKIQNFKLEKEYLGIPLDTDDGDFDYKRAKEGGLDAPFMSIYLPASFQEEKGASKRLADSLICLLYTSPSPRD